MFPFIYINIVLVRAVWLGSRDKAIIKVILGYELLFLFLCTRMSTSYLVPHCTNHTTIPRGSELRVQSGVSCVFPSLPFCTVSGPLLRDHSATGPKGPLCSEVLYLLRPPKGPKVP